MQCRSMFESAPVLLPPLQVSFLVDVRGGVMRGSRGSGLRLFFPEAAVMQPTRITCKFVRAKYWGNVLALLPGDQGRQGLL